MRASRGTATFFPLAASYRFCGDPARGGAGREQVELGSSLKHERRVQEGREPRGKKGRERVVGKAAGDEGPGWQMKSDGTRRAARAVTGPLNRIA